MERVKIKEDVYGAKGGDEWKKEGGTRSLLLTQSINDGVEDMEGVNIKTDGWSGG